jgi:hypothetical protein
MILAQRKKINNKLNSCMKNNPRENPTLATQKTVPSSAPPPKSKSPSYFQNSSRYLLGFSRKLSHAPLQVQVPNP